MSTPQRPAVSAGVYIAMAVTVVAWASAFIVIRGTVPYFSGGAIALGRLIVGTLLLGIVVLIGRTWVAPNRREWLQIIGFGALWFGLYNVALNIAEHTLDAGTTAMLVNIGPILISLGAGLFLREGIPTWLAIGAGVAFVGVILIGVGTSGGTGFGDGVGVLWCLLAAFTYAGVVYLGAVPTAIAFSTWAYALSRMPAGQLGISTYIVPPLAVILGLIVFGEVPAPLAILGAVVCLVGVALSRKRSRVAAADGHSS